MVAGINIAIVLQYKVIPAARRKIADSRPDPCPGCQRPFEIHHEDSADIIPYPFVEYLDKEFTILLSAPHSKVSRWSPSLHSIKMVEEQGQSHHNSFWRQSPVQ